MNEVVTYAIGLVSASACVSLAASRAEVERVVNVQHPTGVGPWAIADEPFSTGEPNPCPCSDHTDRQHWLLHC